MLTCAKKYYKITNKGRRIIKNKKETKKQRGDIK